MRIVIRWFAAMVVFPGLCFGAVAWASLVSFNKVSLKETIEKSSTIVVATRAKVDPARPMKPSDAPFVITETLRGTLKKDTLVYVAPGYQFLSEAIGEQIAQHGYEGVPSPIEDAYSSSLGEAAFGKAKQVILFLGCDEAKLRCELSVLNGYESMKKKAEVLAAIAATRR